MGIPGGRKANFSDPQNEALIAAFRARVKVCEDNGRIFDRLRLVREDMRYLCAAVPDAPYEGEELEKKIKTAIEKRFDTTGHIKVGSSSAAGPAPVRMDPGGRGTAAQPSETYGTYGSPDVLEYYKDRLQKLSKEVPLCENALTRPPLTPEHQDAIQNSHNADRSRWFGSMGHCRFRPVSRNDSRTAFDVDSDNDSDY